jgi:peptidyl-prolyl cis-trans isomerase C
LPYQLGDPVTEAGTALILTTDGVEKTISADEYRQSLQQMTRGQMPQGEQAAQVHRQMVQSMVAQFAVQNSSALEDIEVDTSDVNTQLRQQRSQFPDSSAYRQALQQAGMTEDSLRSMLAMRIKMQEFQQSIAESAEAPTDADVEEYAMENAEIGASHILIQVGEDAPQAKVDSARAVAEALMDSLEAGTPFAELAERNSDGPSARKGGDLGTFTKGRMVDEFAEAAFTMEEEGELYPEPVRTQYGFHIIKLTSAKEPMASEQARSALAEENKQEAVRDEVDRLMADVTVRVNSDVIPVSLKEEDGESDDS